jgi:hypothetical protein
LRKVRESPVQATYVHTQGILLYENQKKASREVKFLHQRDKTVER